MQGASVSQRVWANVVAHQRAESDVHPVAAVDRQSQIHQSLLAEVFAHLGVQRIGHLLRCLREFTNKR